MNKKILFFVYFIVAPEFINGKGVNYHVFTNQLFPSVCHHRMTLERGVELEKVGEKFKTKKALLGHMNSMDTRLCANCSKDLKHTDPDNDGEK